MEIGIEQAIGVLRSGRPLVFPTDTVWGLGVAVEHCASPEVLARAKGRPAGKPVAWLVGDAGALGVYGRDVAAYAHALAEAFWPGALTLVVRASGRVPSAYAGASATVGLRMPDCACALALASGAASPLATTSANFAGAPAPSAAGSPDAAFVAAAGTDVLAAPVAQAPFCAHAAHAGTASAVVDCTGLSPRLLRAGTITASDMQAACGVAFDDAPRA